MTQRTVTLALPEEMYLRFQQTANATRQSLGDLLIHALRVGSPPRWEDAPALFQSELAALDRLDDSALWRIARSQRSSAETVRLAELIEQNTEDDLAAGEREELERLCLEADLFMLRKAHATALLHWRGHTIPPSDKL